MNEFEEFYISKFKYFSNKLEIQNHMRTYTTAPGARRGNNNNRNTLLKTFAIIHYARDIETTFFLIPIYWKKPHTQRYNTFGKC